ncbi:MAG: hypothetical protein ABEI53_01960 [Candidatus Magasanikbacteria bacterium]
MKKFAAFTIFILIFSLSFAFPFISFSAGGEGPDCGDDATICLTNPLGGSGDLIGVVNNVIRDLRDRIAPPVVALMVLYGGFQMLFAKGEPEQFKNGKQTLYYAVIGYVIILVASGISEIITQILTAG